ncbi:uncharacterized protein DSM5745_05035 [Aspergillus mulundensis]|uniref:Protein kinase domain-containing protein n=1 Tax=Aspergillus mulundensis TaxID=1810919 RepID=A0A3D8S5C6_9EURO|nr:hypothetical protein DSM5745_05035 [Aspergillus mulundensis]RDW81478.1 hypothetical protein DSM5745_05035 [Aspergillus mulundensis]
MPSQVCMYPWGQFAATKLTQGSYKFSVTLANPARRDVSAKAASITLGFDVNYDIRHAAQKFGLSEDCDLAQRLGKANMKRRQMLAYHRQHDSKISKHAHAFFDEHVAQDTNNILDATFYQHSPAVNIAVSVPGVKSTKSTEWTQDTTVSTVLNHDILETASDTERTVFSDTGSTADHTVPQSRIPLPPLSDTVVEQTPFICPICCQWIVLKNLTRDWELHVYSDLQPYICMFGDCVQSDQLYGSYREWSEHERQFHRLEWLCVFCSKPYDSKNGLSMHIQREHADVIPESQLQLLTDVSKRPSSRAHQCPLCTKPPISDPETFQFHLARHLQQLALFILTPYDTDVLSGSDNQSFQDASDRRERSDKVDEQDWLDGLDDMDKLKRLDETDDMSETNETYDMDEMSEMDDMNETNETEGPGELSESDDPKSTASTALARFKEGLHKHSVQSSAVHAKFIPIAHVHHLVRKHLLAILREESIVQAESTSRFGRIIEKEAPKVFTILAQVNRERWIIEFLNEGIRDSNLPFMPASTSSSMPLALVTRQGEPIRALETWDNKTIRKLCRKQYCVLSPVFSRGKHYNLNNLHILPFMKKETEEARAHQARAAGGYGEVYREYIHPNHHTFETSSPNNELVVAVKPLSRDQDFELESKVYRDLDPPGHPNLVQLLFTFRMEDKYSCVFPWADGSLRDYWERYPSPEHNSDVIIWSLTQMAGIANGLAVLHNVMDPAPGKSRYGHGDIKAQNILWFRDPKVLKISGLGLVSVRGRDSPIHLSTVVESPTYSPPDKQRGHIVGAKSDIWMLGCLYLEFVTYLVLGNPAIQFFSEQRQEPDSEIPELSSDRFYSADYESVKPSVTLWVKYLKQQARCSSLIHDILDLVMNEMILIHPGSRSTSAEISATLDGLLQRAKEDDKYLLERKVGVQNAPVGLATRPAKSLRSRHQ